MSSLPRAGAAEAHARAHATGVGIEPTPEGCAYRAQAGLNVPRWYQRRMDAGTCVYRGIKPHKVGAMIHGFASVTREQTGGSVTGVAAHRVSLHV